MHVFNVHLGHILRVCMEYPCILFLLNKAVVMSNMLISVISCICIEGDYIDDILVRVYETEV